MKINYQKNKGFTLIEVLVTLVITSIGILGISILQLEALKASQDAITRTKAVNLATDMADRIRTNRLALNFENKDTYEVDDSAPATTIATDCLDTTKAYDPTNETKCTTVELANYDIWEWKRLLENTKSGISGTEVKGKIERVNTENTAGTELTNVLFKITISWKNERQTANQARSYVLEFQP